jgi:hypothetical protein
MKFDAESAQKVIPGQSGSPSCKRLTRSAEHDGLPLVGARERNRSPISPETPQIHPFPDSGEILSSPLLCQILFKPIITNQI